MNLFNQANQDYLAISNSIIELTSFDYYLAKQLTVVALSEQHQNTPQWFSYLLMALSISVRQGHSCLNIADIAGQVWGQGVDEKSDKHYPGYQFPDLQTINQYLTNLRLTPADNQALVFEYNHLYLRRYYRYETALAAFIADRINHKTVFNSEQLQQIGCMLTDLFGQHSDSIDWQKVAVANALNQNFTIIAGGPGTGKTYTVTRLLAALQLLAKQADKRLSIAMVAPTGKAAQRLSESITAAKRSLSTICSDDIIAKIPTTASTIHRLLGVIPHRNEFKHHQDNLLACDVLLVDEASMVDIALFYRLFNALPKHCKVILLGDADQLPSVATGSVLADLAAKPHTGYSAQQADYLFKVCGVELSQTTTQVRDYLAYLYHSRRFDGQGGIGLLAQAVIDGNVELCWQYLSNNTPQLSYFASFSDNQLLSLIKQYYLPVYSLATGQETIAQAFAYFEQFRVLAATKRGVNSVEFINQRIEQLLRGLGVNIPEQHRVEHYHGQPIMIEQNNYQLGVFNGDIGFIWQTEQGLMAVFKQGESYNWLLPSQLPAHSTVFAMTIHKTQGSEFDHVALCLPTQATPILTRELLYTGITRAKSKLTLTGEKAIWQQGVSQQVQRSSLLAQRI